MTCKIKCDCCGAEFMCADWDTPDKWTSFSVKVGEHSSTGKLETESDELHACKDCSAYMTADEMCEAAIGFLQECMLQHERAKVSEDTMTDLNTGEPGEIVKRPKSGLTLNTLIFDAMDELERAVRFMYATEGGACVRINRETSSYRDGGQMACQPTGVITLTVRPE